jgi:lipid-binding SYLF domain-containing protein
MSNQERIDQATQVVREMSNQSDTGTMASMLRSAKGVAIFPSVIKAGLVFGGRYGEGLILRHDAGKNRWYGPSFLDITGASWGLQIGIQSTALVLVITNERGMAGFTGDNVTLGGDLAVTAGPVGRDASASTNLTASIYSYSMSKGLFAGLSLEGAAVDTKQDKNREYWKKDLSSGRILKTRASDPRMASLLNALNSLMRR